MTLKPLKPISVTKILDTISWLIEEPEKWEINFDHNFIKVEVTKLLLEHYNQKGEEKKEEVLKNYHKLTVKELTSKIKSLNLDLPKKGSGKNGNIIKKDILNVLKDNVFESHKQFMWDDIFTNDLDDFKEFCRVLYLYAYQFYDYLMGYFLCIGEPKKCMIGIQEKGYFHDGIAGDGDLLLQIAHTVIEEYPKSFAFAITYYYGAYEYKYDNLLLVDTLDVSFPTIKQVALIEFIKWVEENIKQTIIKDDVMYFDRLGLCEEMIWNQELINEFINKSESV